MFFLPLSVSTGTILGKSSLTLLYSPFSFPLQRALWFFTAICCLNLFDDNPLVVNRLDDSGVHGSEKN
jgi:hypothetical protein